MPNLSPFADDWRDCLRAHYQYVVRNQDHVTERTLVGVLREVGFGDGEVAELKVLATLRADEVDPDFVPDLDALKAQAVEAIQQQAAAEAPPAPDADPAVFAAATLAETPVEPAPLTPEGEEPPDYRAEGPQQMALF